MSEKKDDILAVESDLLRGILDAAEDRENEIVNIEIARKGKVFFTFQIRPLTEQENNRCQDQATRFDRKRGIKIPVETDAAKYRSLLVYTATVNKAETWDNKTLWEKFNVLNGYEVIDKVLHPGEKDAVIRKINEISGYGDDDEDDETIDDLAKN